MINKVLARFVTAHPYVTISVLMAVTVVLGAGAIWRAQPPETKATLPQNSEVAHALAEIGELFGESGEANVVTLVFRGDALTPEGLTQMDDLLATMTSEPSVAPLLIPGNPVTAPSDLIKLMLQVDDFEAVTQTDIDSIQGGPPEIVGALAAMTGNDTDGTPVAVAVIRLQNTNDEQIENAERKISELAATDQGPLLVSSVSSVIIEDEYKQATETGMLPLVGVAFILIAALTFLFLRTISDLLLTIGGLFISVIWIVGTEGWLGPKALDIIGPPNSLTTMVPIIVLGLTVDYSIQIVSHYREQRNAENIVVEAVRTGWNNVSVPLTLAAVTTTVSLFVNLFSPIGIVSDFGVVAGLGVTMSLIVMLTLIPASRTIIDQKREARDTLQPARPISNALPGVQRTAELLGRQLTRKPTPYIAAVMVIVIGLGFTTTRLESEFSIRDILPRGGTLLRDLETLDAAVGGSTEMVTVLVKAEATETRTLLNLGDLTAAFKDHELRPRAVAGPIQASYETYLRDWTNDSGQPGDKYDPELADLFSEASSDVKLDAALMQKILNQLEAKEPGVAHLLVNNPEGVDAILFQFPIYSNDPAQTRALQEEIKALWRGEDDELAATSESIISITVTDSITDRQTEAISSTILAALTVLAVFFWITVRKPALALIAVSPIVLVLISVLGTMALLGIPYTIITAIITALSIGIGVDYTIHMIHRYREEYSHARDPEKAAVQTLSTTGSALLGSALTTALGLGVLVASPLTASQQFGFTAAITIAYSLVISVLVVPPAMTVWGAYQNMRLRSKVKIWMNELDEEIEAVYLRTKKKNKPNLSR